MESTFLDPDSSDALAKEWNLPELPEGNSSQPYPSSSQELAEIFGTSDDEDDDFSFSLVANLNVGKAFTDIDLPETVSESKKFDSSLLGGHDAGLFLNSIQESLGIEHLATPEKQPSETSGGEEGVKVESIGEEGVKVKVAGAEGVKVAPELGGSSGEEEGRVLRKSTRLQHRSREEREGEGRKEDAKGNVTEVRNEEEPEKKCPPPAEETTIKTKDQQPTKSSSSGTESSDVSEGGEGEGEGVGVEVEGSEGEEYEDDESDDPDHLWCICRQPHDDRFMICCDVCEEWYHGDCVGITVGQGKRMEREGKEYVCPICIEKEKRQREQREAGRFARQARRELIKEEIKTRIEQAPQPHPHPLPPSPTKHSPTPIKEGKPPRKRHQSSSSSAPTPTTEEGDQYGLSQLFLPDNAPPTPHGDPREGAERNKIKDEPGSIPCITPGCKNSATPPSLYCSEPCIERYSVEALKQLSDRGLAVEKSPSEFVRGSGGVAVIEKTTGKSIVGMSAPSEKNLASWLKTHPSYQILMPSGKGPTPRSSAKPPRVKSEPKKEPESPSKIKMPTLMDAPSVRANAKKALFNILWRRREGVRDLSSTQEEVEKIANEIEERLFFLHQDISPKYKNKYRSLVFNLKDMKNQGLFRKVLLGEIPPRQLVRMSSEKLASEELAQWRQQTIKKNLEMIKVAEEEAQSHGATIRKKTYKGDVEIEAEDSKDIIETIAPVEDPGKKNKHTPTTTTTSEGGNSSSKSQSHSKSHPQSRSKADSAPKTSMGVLDILTNTTAQHGTHVFDQHCDICMGKVVPPSSSPSSTPPQSHTTTADSSNPSPDSRTMDIEMMDTRSPDSAHPGTQSTELWKGFVNMTGLARFSATAHPVSGSSEYLDQILPSTLHVMGRIAHVQVWDYLDKLRSSTSREIVILRFDLLEEDREPYLSMLHYLVRKHRCGVINCNYYGVKDFYLVPLRERDEIAPQLLPFSGPGLPRHRPDLLLGVIVRSKSRKPPTLQKSPEDIPPGVTVTKIQVQKRLGSFSGEQGEPPLKRVRFQLEVGIGDETPPILDGLEQGQLVATEGESQESRKSATSSTRSSVSELDVGDASPIGGDSLMEDEEKKKEAQTEEKMEVETKADESSSQSIQMSFYGEHQPLPQAQPEPQAPQSSEEDSSAISTSGIQSILSQLSDERLKELASAMSSLNQISSSSTPPSTTMVTSQAATSGSTGEQMPSSSVPQQSGQMGASTTTQQLPPHQSFPSPDQQPTLQPYPPPQQGQIPPVMQVYPSQQQPQQLMAPPQPYPQQTMAPVAPPQPFPQIKQPPYLPNQGYQAPLPHPPAAPHSYQSPPQQAGGYYSPGQEPQPYQQGQPHPPQDQGGYINAPHPPPQQQGYSNYPPPPPDPYHHQDGRGQYGYGGLRYDRPPPGPQQGWDHYGYDERYPDSRYDGVAKLDRIETHDYGHKSGPPPRERDWRRRRYEQERFRDRPRR